MARRGWVSAQTGPEEWHLLSVFDDGWVETPGFARALSDNRADLRRALLGLGILFGGLGMIWLMGSLLSKLDDPPLFLVLIPGVLLCALVIGLSVFRFRGYSRNSQQIGGDLRQAQRIGASRVRRAPGAPLFKRAATAAEYAGWVEGETHVLASDIVDISAQRDGKLHVVTVRLADRPTRVYRSPDGKLTELLCGLRPAITPGR